MTTQQHTSTAPTRNEYVGKHRPPSGSSWAPSPEYGDAPTVTAGVGLSLGIEPHLTLVDLTGGMVRVPLTPEDVEHIFVAVDVHRACAEARRAEVEAAESAAIEAYLEREDRFFRTHPRTEAVA